MAFKSPAYGYGTPGHLGVFFWGGPIMGFNLGAMAIFLGQREREIGSYITISKYTYTYTYIILYYMMLYFLMLSYYINYFILYFITL
jgi:hypothetical protein